MKTETTIEIYEPEIREIITNYIRSKGFTIKGELEINVRSKKDAPEGVVAVDVVSIFAVAEKL